MRRASGFNGSAESGIRGGRGGSLNWHLARSETLVAESRGREVPGDAQGSALPGRSKSGCLPVQSGHLPLLGLRARLNRNTGKVGIENWSIH